ncbi:sporulation protein [Aureisphaera galaxeae]|uniref:sporulation protein n=1 Tax=Aureisphaera galaxeae TaxID=1538023 RepID=UPI00234FD5E0|nr:sporulation protein [Aureisphaera galaxeae]MDC8004621.1 sporulation protein [Aureisphaera galaxeae]
MGFLKKFKDKLGIGGVKVELKVPGQIAKDSGIIEGTVVLTTKSEQEVVDITVQLLEEYTTGRGDDKQEKEFELGEVKVPGGFSIAPGDTKEVPFSLPFTLVKSNADDLKEMGGALGTLGKLGKFANNEKSSYFVDAEADVKSAALDPSDKKEVKLV